jgi:hypothetical protein
VKASTCVKGSGDEEYISIYLGGTCHDQTKSGEDRVRCILDDRDGALAGLLDSPLPGGHGTHADTMLLYAVSTEPGVPVAVLSRVPLQQLADLVPSEWLTLIHLKLPVDPAHPAWTLLDKAFMRVECELAALDIHAF